MGLGAASDSYAKTEPYVYLFPNIVLTEEKPLVLWQALEQQRDLGTSRSGVKEEQISSGESRTVMGLQIFRIGKGMC